MKTPPDAIWVNAPPLCKLDAMIDAALRYRPKNKVKMAKPRKRRKAKRNVQDRESK